MSRPSAKSPKVTKSTADMFSALLSASENTYEAAELAHETDELVMETLLEGNKITFTLETPQEVVFNNRSGYILGQIEVFGTNLTINAKHWDSDTEEVINAPAGKHYVDAVTASVYEGTIRLTAWM